MRWKSGSICEILSDFTKLPRLVVQNILDITKLKIFHFSKYFLTYRMHVWPKVAEHSDACLSRHWVLGPSICPPRIDGCGPRVWCWVCGLCAPGEILSSWHPACCDGLDQESLDSLDTRISWEDVMCCQQQGEVWYYWLWVCCHWYWPPCQPQQPHS